MCLWVPAHSRHTPREGGGVGTQSHKGSTKKFGAFGAKGTRLQVPKPHSLMQWRRGEVGREQGDAWGEMPETPEGGFKCLNSQPQWASHSPAHPAARAVCAGKHGCLFLLQLPPVNRKHKWNNANCSCHGSRLCCSGEKKGPLLHCHSSNSRRVGE